MRSRCASLNELPKCSSVAGALCSGVADDELGRGTLCLLRFTTRGLGDEESLSSTTTTRFFRRLTTTTEERSANCAGAAEELLSLLDGWRFFLGRLAFDCTPMSRGCIAGGSTASADCFAIVFLFKEPGGLPGLRFGLGAYDSSGLVSLGISSLMVPGELSSSGIFSPGFPDDICLL